MSVGALRAGQGGFVGLLWSMSMRAVLSQQLLTVAPKGSGWLMP